jgi:hypothetical protein
VAVPYSSVPHTYSVLRFRVPKQSLVVRSQKGRRPLTRISSRVIQGGVIINIMMIALTGCIHQH